MRPLFRLVPCQRPLKEKGQDARDARELFVYES